MRKTNFTMQCTVRLPAGQGEDKMFQGSALTKKQAKTNAAAIAWAEVGAGVTQSSVESLLTSHRSHSTAAEPAVSDPAPATVTPTPPKVVIHKPTGRQGF